MALAMSASEAEAVAATLAEPIGTEDARAIAEAQASRHQHSKCIVSSDHVTEIHAVAKECLICSLRNCAVAIFCWCSFRDRQCGSDNASIKYNTAKRLPKLWYVRQGEPLHLVRPVTSSLVKSGVFRGAERVCCCKLAGGATGETTVSWTHGGPPLRRCGLVRQGTSSNLTRRRLATHPERARRASAGTASRTESHARLRDYLHWQCNQQVREPSRGTLLRDCCSYEEVLRVVCITVPPHCHFGRFPELLR